MLLEELCQYYRIFIPIPVWFRYLISYGEFGNVTRWSLGILLALLYLILKVGNINIIVELMIHIITTDCTYYCFSLLCFIFMSLVWSYSEFYIYWEMEKWKYILIQWFSDFTGGVDFHIDYLNQKGGSRIEHTHLQQ